MATIIPDLNEIQIRNKFNKILLNRANRNLRSEGLIEEKGKVIDVEKLKLSLKKTAQQIRTYSNAFIITGFTGPSGPLLALLKSNLKRIEESLDKITKNREELFLKLKDLGKADDSNKDERQRLIDDINKEDDKMRKRARSRDVVEKEIKDIEDGKIQPGPVTPQSSAKVIPAIGTNELQVLGPKLTINTNILSSELEELSSDPSSIPRSDLIKINDEVKKDLVPAMLFFYSRFPSKDVENVVWPPKKTGPVPVFSLEIQEQALSAIKIFNRDLDANFEKITSSIETLKNREFSREQPPQVVGRGGGVMPRKFL